MQGHLTRFQDLAGVFTINDPQAIGSDLAAKQLNRKNLVITSVDGAPDIEAALEGRQPRCGLGEPGPLCDGAAGGRDRLRHHERQEAGRPDDPDALDPDHPRQHRELQGLVGAAVLRSTSGTRAARPGAPAGRSAHDGRCRRLRRASDRLRSHRDRSRPRRGRDVQESRRAVLPPTSPSASCASACRAPSWAWSATTASAAS